MSDRSFIERWLIPTTDLLARYHRFETRGIEHVPRSGPLLIVATHSALTYDLLLGLAAIYRRTGRIVRPLGHRLWFQLPYVRSIASKIGVVPADPTRAEELLRAGEIVAVTPGGMWEALRPSRDRFQLRWDGRQGFARLASAAEAPIVVAACPAADRAVTIYRSAVTDHTYRRFGLPLPLIRGIGPTLVPRPVKLTAHFSELMPHRAELSVDQLAELVAARMRRLIDDAVREDGL